MCLVCHQMSTESGGCRHCHFLCVHVLLTARLPLPVGPGSASPDLWLLQSCSASSDAPPAAARAGSRRSEGWWGQDEDIRCTAMPSVLAPEGLWVALMPRPGHLDLCPWSYFVLRLHEFSIPLGKQFRALILKQIWIPDPRIPVYLANCSLESMPGKDYSWMLW